MEGVLLMLRYYRRNLTLALAAIIINILAQLTSPVVALMEQQMIDLITEGNLLGFYDKLLWAGCIVITTAFIYLLNALVQKKFKVRFEESFRNDLYDGIMQQDFVRFREKDTAEQMSFVKSHASTISNNFTSPIFILISYGVMAVAVLGIILHYSPLLAFFSIICSLLSTLPPLYFNKKLSKQLLEKLDRDAVMTFQLKEALNGHETIWTFGVFSKIRRRFAKSSRNLADSDCKMGVTISLLENISRITQKITWFASFLLAGGMAVRGDITVGTLVMFITLFDEFDSCVTLYAQTIPILLSTRADIKKMLSIIDNKEAEFTGKAFPSHKRGVEVCDLSFRYSSDLPLLEHLNLNIRRGEKVALIGASGCGKSTLIRLLSGYYSNYSGSILYDGTELHELDVQKLRKLVTVIPQNAFIFNDSIRFNICLDEEFPDETMKNALRLSGVDRFLPDIPGGLDGECGENGSLLSGGQKQRIALARAFIRGVNMLILDEGVSAIDVETANEIEQEILNIKDLTLLTITHRIKDGLTDKYNRVMIMENGRLKERG